MTTIEGPEKIEHARWLAVRSALRLEIRTGMRHSSGKSARVLANKITGKDEFTKRAAYDALNAKIVEALGPDFDRPYE